MNDLPKYVSAKVVSNGVLQVSAANREADRLDEESRYAWLDGRTAQAKKFSRHADKLRSLARKATH